MADTLYTTTAVSQGGRAGGKVALQEGGLYFHMEHSKGLGGSGECEVGIGRAEGGLSLSAKLVLSIPGMDRAQVQELLDAAHQVCPYSKATRNNVPVELAVEG
ncbi:MAG: OsmC family protein [Hyphomonadaceae bacterium]|nr:OsmC family protein [Hyphomonadaceae bacterium]